MGWAAGGALSFDYVGPLVELVWSSFHSAESATGTVEFDRFGSDKQGIRHHTPSNKLTSTHLLRAMVRLMLRLCTPGCELLSRSDLGSAWSRAVM